MLLAFCRKLQRNMFTSPHIFCGVPPQLAVFFILCKADEPQAFLPLPRPLPVPGQAYHSLRQEDDGPSRPSRHYLLFQFAEPVDLRSKAPREFRLFFQNRAQSPPDLLNDCSAVFGVYVNAIAHNEAWSDGLVILKS